MADIRHKAVATAGDYNAGAIASLDDAMTRRLIASVALTLSRGGDHDFVNRLGYVGRYRAGAEFLAEAGYIDGDRLQQAMSGHRNEWAWARTGGMAAFLEDRSNWTSGLSLDAYRQSPELQDRAFKINAENHHARALAEGVFGDDEKPGRIAGFLKAAHIVGFNHAREAMTGGRAHRDFNGVSNYHHMHDISRNGDGLDKPLAAALSRNDGDLAPSAVSLSDATHPQHTRFLQVHAALAGLPGVEQDPQRERAAASLLVAAASAGFRSVDHVVPGAPGVVFAVEGDPYEPSKRIALNLAQLAGQSVETSTAQLAVLDAQADPALAAVKETSKHRSV